MQLTARLNALIPDRVNALIPESPTRAVRLRLAALYGFVFAASCAVLLAIVIVAAFGFRARESRSVFGTVQQNQFAADFRAIVIVSAIVLAVGAAASVWLGWVLAGRAVRPVEASFDAQRRFVANASHELRTPLARLKTLTQVALSDRNADVASLRAAHERVLASEQELEQLIDGLLTLAAGQEGLRRRKPVDLAAVTGDVLAARAAEIDGSGLRLTSSLDPASTTGDPQLVERLVENIVDNAIRHNAPRGRIEVATATAGGRALVSVINDGAALSGDELERLKQPFGRAGADRTGDGHGLGMSIVGAIADAHKATIAATALPEGGLRLEVRFPEDLSSSSRGD
jgi:signal transduction histidine kinase